MADVRQTRRTLLTVLVALLVLDVVCAAVLLSPIGRGAREGRQKETQLWNELKAKTRQTEPLTGLDKKIATAKVQIQSFYDERFPSNFARVPERLSKLASENGVTLASARYSTEDTDIPGIRVVHIMAGIDGDYVKEAKFINAVERDQTFFIVDSISLGEQQKGAVHLQIVFDTFVRSQAGS